MNKDLITLNEVQNNGRTIHLYFNPEVGRYVADGFSAFFAAHIVDVIAAFSEDLQMPVALMRTSQGRSGINSERISGSTWHVLILVFSLNALLIVWILCRILLRRRKK